jgi:rhamnosyl/mannosyltransferase
VRALAEAQAARGHTVTALVNSLNARTHVETLNGVRVIYAGRWFTVSSTPLGLAFPHLVATQDADIVHLQFPYPWGEAANYFFGRARRTVITYQSDIIRQVYTRAFYRPLMHRVLKRADRLIATSPNYLHSSPVLRKFADKCVVIPLGIDPTPFENPDLRRAEEIRARYLASPTLSPHGRTHPGSGFLLFVGQFRYYKGLDYMLRALCELPEARLIMVGQGPMEQAWRGLAVALGVQDRVSFVSGVHTEELPAYYAAADVFVLPASERSEAFGLVQLEAMAAGRPVVSTEIGTGTSYVNADGETGLVVPARDPHALAAAVARLLDDPALCARMGTAGRERVRSEFNLETMVERVMAVYRDVLARK